MESSLQNLSRGNPSTSQAPPVERVGGLGKFGTFWMPKSPQEIAQRTGARHNQESSGKELGPKDKGAATQKNTERTSFRDLIRQKQDIRQSGANSSPAAKIGKSKSQAVPSRPSQSKLTPNAPQQTIVSGRLGTTHSSKANAGNLGSERVVADKPVQQTSNKKELQEVIKHAKDSKERYLGDQEGSGEQNAQDDGMRNAKREHHKSSSPVSSKSAEKPMSPIVKECQQATPLSSGETENKVTLKAGLAEVANTEMTGQSFLRSDAKSQRDARRGFVEIRSRIAGFMNGETRVARMAIDLPGGGRLGIKMRFLGDQLEVIFATEDMSLRAAISEDWKRLAQDMGKAGSNLLPPAFAQENYEGIVRGQWDEAA
tara:strand:+ start:11515 stop:12627 length:1113 start_codon:yes stop_codon:yes gene_type:complete